MTSPNFSGETTQSFNDMHGHLQDENTWLINFTEHSPLDWAIPLYGYLMPFLVAVTTVTNTFIIIVLSQKHLRTPTNAVLLSMAVTDLLTGCCSVPWFVYYYTLKGYQADLISGISAFWCHAYGYMFEMLPSAFHTAAIWLAVFLAVQRYVYVCVPNHVYLFCTPKTTKLTIIGIIMASFVTLLPEVTTRKRFAHHNTFTHRVECYQYFTAWVNWVGKDIVFSGYLWVRVVLHAVPCILLLIFTCKLGSTLKQAENRKKSWAAVESSRKPSCRGSMSSGRSLYATTRMLAMICSVFLLLEIPAAILHGVQFALAMGWLTPSAETISRLNKGLVIRNILIVLVSPIQFGIYCSMSEQFRLTVRQLFTSRLLFVAQAQATFHGGKRYSLVLVDLDEDDSKQGATGMRCFGYLNKDNEKELRKVGLQMSVCRSETTSAQSHERELIRTEENDLYSVLRHSTVTWRLTYSVGASSV